MGRPYRRMQGSSRAGAAPTRTVCSRPTHALLGLAWRAVLTYISHHFSTTGRKRVGNVNAPVSMSQLYKGPSDTLAERATAVIWHQEL